MSTVWFLSDWHLKDERLSRRMRGHKSSEEHDYVYREYYKANVEKRDVVWMLGDMSLTAEHFVNFFKDLPGSKKLIMGNHCFEDGGSIFDCADILDYAGGAATYSTKTIKAWLTHIPMHESELYSRVNIHGHTHRDNVQHERYFNVCPENIFGLVGRPLISLDEIKSYFKSINNP